MSKKHINERFLPDKAIDLIDEAGAYRKLHPGEGADGLVVDKEVVAKLRINGQIATQYVGPTSEPTALAPFNPNGSSYAIEGIISRDGLILGKMGHSERYEENLFKNISGNKQQEIFVNAVNYFKK